MQSPAAPLSTIHLRTLLPNNVWAFLKNVVSRGYWNGSSAIDSAELYCSKQYGIPRLVLVPRRPMTQVEGSTLVLSASKEFLAQWPTDSFEMPAAIPRGVIVPNSPTVNERIWLKGCELPMTRAAAAAVDLLLVNALGWDRVTDGNGKSQYINSANDQLLIINPIAETCVSAEIVIDISVPSFSVITTAATLMNLLQKQGITLIPLRLPGDIYQAWSPDMGAVAIRFVPMSHRR